eukprot:6498876-Prymnesium_polylepis.1
MQSAIMWRKHEGVYRDDITACAPSGTHARAHARAHTRTYTYTCMCACVCVREGLWGAKGGPSLSLSPWRPAGRRRR